MKNDILKIDSVQKYNDLVGLPTLHPQVAIVDLNEATRKINHVSLNFGLYILWLKNGVNCSLYYGRQKYDYQEGTIVSLAPGQVVTVESEDENPKQNVQGLIFHPDLLNGTPLAQKIHEYSYFGYDQREALHLSRSERDTITGIMSQIKTEIESPADSHSKKLITDSIGLMLDYCMRFYDRQFITRKQVNSDLLSKFEKELNDYLHGTKMEEEGLPTVQYFANKVFLSSGYFGDLVKKETGETAKAYIQNKVIGMAKGLLSENEMNINQISDRLGFKYPQHFTRLFKMATGMTPREYKQNE